MKEELYKLVEKIESLKNKKDIIKALDERYILAGKHFKIEDGIMKKIIRNKDKNIQRLMFDNFLDDVENDRSKQGDIRQKFNEAWNKIKVKRSKKLSSSKKLGVLINTLESFSSFGTSTIPQKEFITTKSAFIVNNGVPYLLTAGKRSFFGMIDEEDADGGLCRMQKSSIKLISALNLARDEGEYNFFIGDNEYYLNADFYDLNSKELDQNTVKEIKKTITLLNKISIFHSEGSKGKFCTNKLAKDEEDRCEKLMKKIDTSNGVLMRCLYYYTKACAFKNHLILHEEANALLCFCLDGVTKLLMEKYELEKIADLDDLLIKNFGCPYATWLKECYDERTVYVHPHNRFNQDWYPNLMPCSFLEAFILARVMLNIYILEEFVPKDDDFNLEVYLENR